MSALTAMPPALLGVLAVVALFAVVRVMDAVHGLRARTSGRGLVAVVAAAIAAATLSRASLPVQLLTGTLLLAGGAALVWHRRTRSASIVGRWGAKSRRKSGVASTLDVRRVASARAMRRKARVVRPSLGDLTRRQRMRVPTTEVATRLCKVGSQRVWCSVEDVVSLFGGPRAGKTGWLAGTIIDAPGAVLSTSTRTDLHRMTSPLRSRGGRPVWVFNPAGLGGFTSTLAFDPVHGCADPVTATERAADMIPAASGGDAERWDAQARRILAVLLHAAALNGLSMAVVAEWVADPDAAEREVISALRRSPDASAYVEAARQFIGTNHRTRSSVTASIMPAVAWLTSPAAVAATTGGHQLEVAELLTARGTVYLLGREEAHTAPLLAALTGHLAREGRRIAAHQPGGRLDPPLLLALDECARIAPIPLPDWTGDMGGAGVTIIAAFQSRADVTDCWGPTGAAKVINNSGAIMLFGGTKDSDDLQAWSELAGDRDEPITTTDSDGTITSRSVRKVPVIAPAQLANLPELHVVVFRRHLSPVVGRVRMAWRRRDVRGVVAHAKIAERWASGPAAIELTAARPAIAQPGAWAGVPDWAGAPGDWAGAPGDARPVVGDHPPDPAPIHVDATRLDREVGDGGR